MIKNVILVQCCCSVENPFSRLFPSARVNARATAVLRHRLCHRERDAAGHRAQLQHQGVQRAPADLHRRPPRLQPRRAHPQMRLLQIPSHVGVAHHGKDLVLQIVVSK